MSNADVSEKETKDY